MAITDTAYLVAVSRSLHPEQSKDPYASKWIPNERRSEIIDAYIRFACGVYRYNHIDIAIRSNFFISNIESMIKKGATQIVNLGSGFSSYYPLFHKKVRRIIDIDDVSIIDQRKRVISEFFKLNVDNQIEGNMMEVEFQLIDDIKIEEKTLFILEGVSYFLNEGQLKILIGEISSAFKDAYLLFDYWPKRSSESPIFDQLRRSSYMDGFSKDFAFCDWIFDFAKDVCQKAGCIELEEAVFGTRLLTVDSNVLDERYAVIKL